MSNTEIDFQLALDIGYTPDRVRITGGKGTLYAEFVQVLNDPDREDGPIHYGGGQRFDHTDPAVFAAIGKKFDCFPRQVSDLEPDWWCVKVGNKHFDSNIPERATALAVIEHCKKGQP